MLGEAYHAPEDVSDVCHPANLTAVIAILTHDEMTGAADAEPPETTPAAHPARRSRRAGRDR
jgi:hypothetical protein